MNRISIFIFLTTLFKKQGVAQKLIPAENGEKGLQGTDPKTIHAAYGQVLLFIQ